MKARYLFLIIFILEVSVIGALFVGGYVDYSDVQQEIQKIQDNVDKDNINQENNNQEKNNGKGSTEDKNVSQDEKDKKRYNEIRNKVENGSIEAAIKLGKESTVILERQEGRTVSQGAGFVVEGGHILTAAHVINGNDGKITVKFSNGQESTASVIGQDSVSDIAVLQTRTRPPVEELKIASHTPITGEKTAAIGNPGGGGMEVSTGILDSTGKIISYNDVQVPSHIKVKMNLEKGYSGGPIINKKGKVIGVIRGNDMQTKTGYAVSNIIINDVKEEIIETRDYINYRTNIEVSKVKVTRDSDEIAGLIVTNAPKNSKLRSTNDVEDDLDADIIIGLGGNNNYPVTDRNSFLTALMLRTDPGDDSVIAKVKRGNIETLVELKLRKIK